MNKKNIKIFLNLFILLLIPVFVFSQSVPVIKSEADPWFRSYGLTSIGNYNITGNWSFLGNISIYNLTYINYENITVNSAEFWDDLDDPSDINAGDITDDGTYLTSETDPQVGILEENKWCISNGTQVNCNQTAPTGDGGIIPGNCPDGYVVQNTTETGVECVPQQISNIDVTIREIDTTWYFDLSIDIAEGNLSIITKESGTNTYLTLSTI